MAFNFYYIKYKLLRWIFGKFFILHEFRHSSLQFIINFLQPFVLLCHITFSIFQERCPELIFVLIIILIRHSQAPPYRFLIISLNFNFPPLLLSTNPMKFALIDRIPKLSLRFITFSCHIWITWEAFQSITTIALLRWHLCVTFQLLEAFTDLQHPQLQLNPLIYLDHNR